MINSADFQLALGPPERWPAGKNARPTRRQDGGIQNVQSPERRLPIGARDAIPPHKWRSSRPPYLATVCFAATLSFSSKTRMETICPSFALIV